MSQAAGRAALTRRVDRAVAQVCAAGGDRSLATWAATRRCMAETRERTLPAIEVAMGKGATRLASIGTSAR